MALFQIYRVETNVIAVAEAEGLTAYRLISFVFETLGIDGEEKLHELTMLDQHLVHLMQKYHPFNDNAPSRECMIEADAKTLATACGWSVPHLLRYAAEHWAKHDAARRGRRAAP